MKWKAELSARKAYKKWNTAGKPNNPMNPLYIEKQKSSSELRKVKYNELRNEGIEVNNLIMEAEYKDSKKLSKIIRWSRNDSRGETAMLKVQGQQYNGEAQILAGCFEYHKKGSKPPELTYDPDDLLYGRATVDVTSIR